MPVPFTLSRRRFVRAAALFDGVFVGWVDATDLVGPQDVDTEFNLDAVLMRPPGAA